MPEYLNHETSEIKWGEIEDEIDVPGLYKAELELNEKGELKEKAAIRQDWVNTRSRYCYKEKA